MKHNKIINKPKLHTYLKILLQKQRYCFSGHTRKDALVISSEKRVLSAINSSVDHLILDHCQMEGLSAK